METITDTRLDSRWISLPDQPYKVRSAMCAPMVSGNRIFGVMTLTHPEVRHFQHPFPDLIASMADQMALVLENAKFQLANQDLERRLSRHQEFCHHLFTTSIVGAMTLQNNKIVQINSRAAQLFGREPDDLLHLPSIKSVIAYEDLDRLRVAIGDCYANPEQVLTIDFGITHRSGQVKPITAQGIAFDFQEQPAVMLIMNE